MGDCASGIGAAKRDVCGTRGGNVGVGPSAEPERMRLAFASCTNWEMGYFSAYRHMAEENPDLVLFLGDYIYESTFTGPGTEKVVRKHDDDSNNFVRLVIAIHTRDENAINL